VALQLLIEEDWIENEHVCAYVYGCEYGLGTIGSIGKYSKK
jgi:hypothetical protein